MATVLSRNTTYLLTTSGFLRLLSICASLLNQRMNITGYCFVRDLAQ